MKTTLKNAFVFLACVALVGVSYATEFSIKGTVFERAGYEFNVDPLLLYSVALVESAVDGEQKGTLKPSPWTLRTNKPIYCRSKEEAQEELYKQLKRTKSIDVGLMQINTKWHKHRVKKVSDLLNPETNVRVAAQILSENIRRYPNDAVMAIGAYHNSNPERARWYAHHVLRVYTNLRRN